jgi:2-iminobutanoate/2-iminopropanoate deaminase
MTQTTRRRFLAVPAVAAAAMAVPALASEEQAPAAPVKKVHWNDGKRPEKPPLFSGVVSYGNLVFISGIGDHFDGDIKADTYHVLKEIQKRLESAGS